MLRVLTLSMIAWIACSSATAWAQGEAEGAPAVAEPTPIVGSEAAEDEDAARAAALAHLRFGLEELARLQAADAERVRGLAQQSSGVAPADLTEVQARLAALEAQQQELTAAVDQAETARQELEESVFDQLARRITLSGYSTTYFRSSDTRRASFRAFRFNLLFDARVTDRLRFFGEMEMEDAARIGEGAGALEVEQAFFEFSVGQALTLRAGILLVPFGYFNRLHEGWRYAFTARPVMSEWVFPSTYADVGVSTSGTLYRGDQNQLRYEVAVINGLMEGLPTEFSGEGLRDARPAFDLDKNASPAGVAHLALLLSDVLELGVSGYFGRYADQGHAAVGMAGADALLSVGTFTLRAEGIYAWVQDGGREQDTDGDPSTPPVFMPYPDHLMGAVVEAELRFWPHALANTFLGDFDNPSFFVAARFDVAEQGFRHVQHELTFSGSVGYRPVHRSAIRVEYAHGSGDFALGDGWQLTVAFAMGY